MAAMIVVVAGGTGFLGSRLVRVLRQGGHTVTVLTRSPRAAGEVSWPAQPGESGWERTIDGADAVVNLAGAGIADGRWTDRRKEVILESRTRATRALVEAIGRASRPPRVLLSGSAIGIYGTSGDQPLTEETPPGADFLASVCRRWEDEARAAAGITRVVLLRTGLVLSKDGGALPRMAMPFRLFAGGPIGSGRQFMSWIHLDDWVAMVDWALATEAVGGPLNLTAPEPVTNADFSRALGRAMQRPSALPAPPFALRLALGEMADALILGGQRVLPAKAAGLGFEFRYRAIDDALRAIYGAGSTLPDRAPR
jgi:uncharacterized protein (TIGR01777 family)